MAIKPISLLVRLDPGLLASIDGARGQVARSVFIRSALERACVPEPPPSVSRETPPKPALQPGAVRAWIEGGDVVAGEFVRYEGDQPQYRVLKRVPL